jgi:LysR family transcriptional regulator (chromosome initiation inhibitor)
VTPSAISQRIKALEAGAGRVLLRRSRPVRPTEQGELLLRSARQLLVLADEALLLLRAGPDADRAERLRVPIVVNADSIATWFAAAVIEIGRDGRIELEVRRDDEHVTADLLRSGEVMGAVTAEPSPVQGCAVRRLGTMTYRAKASRRFVRTWFPDGATAAALASAPVVQYDRKDLHQNRLLARLAPDARPPQVFVPDSVQFVECVRAGVGWAMVPDLQDPDDSLVTLDPDWTWPVALHWQAWKLSSPGLEGARSARARRATPAPRHTTRNSRVTSRRPPRSPRNERRERVSATWVWRSR